MNTLPGIPNFAEVDPDSVYRGGQPTDEGWNALKAAGVTTVIKLNLESEAPEVAAEALGMALIYEPIDLDEQLLFRPRKASVQAAVNAIVPNTFIHCGSDARTASADAKEDNTQGGQDRTGLIVGCYRVWRQGWSKDAAWKEMRDHGFHEALLGLTLFWEWSV